MSGTGRRKLPSPRAIVKFAMKRVAGLAGLDIIHIGDNPRAHLLGIGSMPIGSIIDVGANVGQFAMHMAKVFPKAKIYCFEPLPGPFEELSTWANGFGGRVEVFNMALGEAAGTVEMHLHEDHTPSSSLLESTNINRSLYPIIERQKPVSVQLDTLDSAMADILPQIVPKLLVKLDVQGYEDRVIRGGKATISKADIVILEVSNESFYENQARFKDLLIMLDELGLHYQGNLDQYYGPNGRVLFYDALFSR